MGAWPRALLIMRAEIKSAPYRGTVLGKQRSDIDLHTLPSLPNNVPYGLHAPDRAEILPA